jgi:hypothetical protein
LKVFQNTRFITHIIFFTKAKGNYFIILMQQG